MVGGGSYRMRYIKKEIITVDIDALLQSNGSSFRLQFMFDVIEDARTEKQVRNVKAKQCKPLFRWHRCGNVVSDPSPSNEARKEKKAVKDKNTKTLKLSTQKIFDQEIISACALKNCPQFWTTKWWVFEFEWTGRNWRWWSSIATITIITEIRSTINKSWPITITACPFTENVYFRRFRRRASPIGATATVRCSWMLIWWFQFLALCRLHPWSPGMVPNQCMNNSFTWWRFRILLFEYLHPENFDGKTVSYLNVTEVSLEPNRSIQLVVRQRIVKSFRFFDISSTDSADQTDNWWHSTVRIDKR